LKGTIAGFVDNIVYVFVAAFAVVSNIVIIAKQVVSRVVIFRMRLLHSLKLVILKDLSWPEVICFHSPSLKV
jgi:hypothetical protein